MECEVRKAVRACNRMTHGGVTPYGRGDHWGAVKRRESRMMVWRWPGVLVITGALLLAAIPGTSLVARAAGRMVSEPVYGLPASGNFQLLQDGRGTGNWVLGPGRRPWAPRGGGRGE